MKGLYYIIPVVGCSGIVCSICSTEQIHLFFFLLITTSLPKQGADKTNTKANTKTPLILFITNKNLFSTHKDKKE